MKDYEKKLLKFTLSEKIKNQSRIFYGLVNDSVYYGNAYFFGLVKDNLLNIEKFEQIHIEKIIKNDLINADENKLVVTNYNITKGDDGLVLANFKISYDSDYGSMSEISCNYKYYKLFEKDCCYIYDVKGMLCLYDENKNFIGVISKVINR